MAAGDLRRHGFDHDPLALQEPARGARHGRHPEEGGEPALQVPRDRGRRRLRDDAPPQEEEVRTALPARCPAPLAACCPCELPLPCWLSRRLLLRHRPPAPCERQPASPPALPFALAPAFPPSQVRGARRRCRGRRRPRDALDARDQGPRPRAARLVPALARGGLQGARPAPLRAPARRDRRGGARVLALGRGGRARQQAAHRAGALRARLCFEMRRRGAAPETPAAAAFLAHAPWLQAGLAVPTELPAKSTACMPTPC